MPSVLLFSGGVDSFVAWHYLGRPQTVYFNLQSRYSHREIPVVRSLIPDTIIEENTINLGGREIGEKAYIPFRNFYLAGLGFKYADTVVIAGNKDDMVGDKNRSVFRDMSRIYSRMEGRKLHVISPFWNMSKADIIAWYLKQGLSSDDLYKTISCYQPHAEGNYCGACPACFRKWVAFHVNHLDLPFSDFLLMAEYYESAKSGKYSRQRNYNIIQTVEEAWRNVNL